MLSDIIQSLIFLLLCGVGAYFITKAISRRWKEKIPQSKGILFITIFALIFITLGVAMAVASTLIFGR